MALELIQRLCEHARTIPDAQAFLQLGSVDHATRVLTYQELHASVAASAARFERQLPTGAVVMLCHANELEYVVAFFAVLAVGATVFPVHPQLTAPELIDAARHARANAIIGHRYAVESLQRDGVRELKTVDVPSPEGDPDGLEASRSEKARLLLQSSGTMGRPKLVQRSGPSLDSVARNVANSVGLSPDDRVLGLVPACHSYGMENIMLGPLFAGAGVTLCQSFDTSATLDRLANGEFTVFPGVPTMFELLAASAHEKRPLNKLRCAYSAGAILPESVYTTFHDRFGIRLGQLFGMTEVGSVTFNDANASDHNPTDVGAGMAGVQLRIVDADTRDIGAPLPPNVEGEVAVSAPSMLTGYLRAEDGICATPTAMRDGFLLTGDLGRLDAGGRLTITGRAKLIVDIAGMKVNLTEVERTLEAHPGVAECAVVPVRVTQTVLRLKAYVVPGGEVTIEGLRAFARARLTAYKLPRAFEFRKSLPRSATGKLLRHRL